MMSKYAVWDFMNSKQINEIALWGRELSWRDQAKLDQKVAMLERMDLGILKETKLVRDLVPGVAGPILRIRVRGDQVLSPLLCQGPQSPDEEYTFLAGAVEVRGQLEPEGVAVWAEAHRQKVESSEGWRCRHEWFARKTDPGFLE